ncbi:Asp-tRNA(Asn)/Glu-tRNA(Gln) amidotransferase subunit GatC [Patescibacteria group bacterium]|nr:Asp-tRNA(Asn)/Glu-tRNA(Gln) amidotransferase subunit GatC [Patescibacteria group bacterium]
MKFEEKDLLHLADLAKLELSPEELKTYNEQLEDILSYIEKVNQLDLENIKESLSGAVDLDNGPRPDRVVESDKSIISQAGRLEGDYVLAPNVFEK